MNKSLENLLKLGVDVSCDPENRVLTYSIDSDKIALREGSFSVNNIKSVMDGIFSSRFPEYGEIKSEYLVVGDNQDLFKSGVDDFILEMRSQEKRFDGIMNPLRNFLFVPVCSAGCIIGCLAGIYYGTLNDHDFLGYLAGGTVGLSFGLIPERITNSILKKKFPLGTFTTRTNDFTYNSYSNFSTQLIYEGQ
ncbi:Uncharacterised protein [uncultured archaeon]|nr:Uncharacterised protein [uncultured archaeon]